MHPLPVFTFRHYGYIILLFCLFGTLQSLFSLYDLMYQFHGPTESWLTYLLESATTSLLRLLASSTPNDYHLYLSWLDIAFNYLLLACPLIPLCWLTRNRPVLLLSLNLLYAALIGYMINISLFYDFEASWSTYSSRDVFYWSAQRSKVALPISLIGYSLGVLGVVTYADKLP